MNILTHSELRKMQDSKEDFLLLNVLSEDSFRKACIPGSINVPVATPGFLHTVAELAGTESKHRRIVTYCAGMHCSASIDAANYLTAAGYTRVSAYQGGLQDWMDAGYALVSGISKPCTEQCSA
jgi:rhodanese-related sulfurtransferase